MALLDMLQRGAQRAGSNLEKYVGGLLGEDYESLSPQEKRQLRQQSLAAIFDAMGRGTTATAGLQGVAEAAGGRVAARREQQQQEQRMQAAQQASGQIAGRLLGGAPVPTAPGPMGGDELTGVNVQSQYRRDPMDALRLGMSPAGLDAMKINPMLQPMLQDMMKPQEIRPFKFMSGPNGAIFAIDDMTGQVKEIVKAPPPVVATPGGQASYEGLRKEWTSLTKDYREIGNMWAKIREAGTNPTAANDLAMIFGYMKILDPGSVVREGEFANAQNTAGVPGKIRSAYNNVLRGERLNPEQRQEFLQSAYGAVKSQIPVLQGLEQQFTQIAAADRLDPSRIIVNPLQGALLPKVDEGAAGQAVFDKLPVGALFEAPDGSIRRKTGK